MNDPDLILLHPPSIFRFREEPVFRGPVSDVVPSSSIFEFYPLGFLTLATHLETHGVTTRIVNLALKMLRDEGFDPAAFLAGLHPCAFGIDLHWLPHVDGALSLAALLKQLHPDIPVILGGLSATYYRDELMRDHPEIDFIVCGDSTEEPLLRLMNAIARQDGYAGVPNLLWRNAAGAVVDNGLTWSPASLDELRIDYLQPLRMALRDRDLVAYLPFHGWLDYPVSAVITCRGCSHNCLSCGGSREAFRRVCRRQQAVFRSPELVARDIIELAAISSAPIFVLGDLLQAGRDYGERLIDALEGTVIPNQIAIEFFSPPPVEFLHRLSRTLPNYNVEISPESHDPKVRRSFGKLYDNAELEQAIAALLDNGCRRVDLFFMIGLPYQDHASVMATIDYCGELLARFGRNRRLLPMISPLAPFIDPGSPIFEAPDRYGYRIFHRTLAEHRRASLAPSWEFTLNYETRWMSRRQIVQATYDAGAAMVTVKERFGLLSPDQAGQIRAAIARARDLLGRIDGPGRDSPGLREEIAAVNRLATICGRHELEWPVHGSKLHLLGIARRLLTAAVTPD
ncbi:MAG: TIGR04190 family B12-binding domain/radical SAM domain protein [Deltaproteobacteria bacterium]|nr:MAG: TIGR04190 family B12-binding domain/radical SAM domain protein [Deltaproteobacteria bacterium]